jgi:hypothetical protein
MGCPNCVTESSFFGFSVDHRCTIKDEIVTDEIKWKFQCTGNYYSDCEIYKRYNSGTGCFLTTIVHKILGKKDNDSILENFRSFRDNVLQKDSKYYDVLKMYDTVGPMIVECIELDDNREKMANTIFKNILLPLNDKINNHEYDHAVNMYQCMTMFLIEYYGLMPEYEKIKDRDYGYISFDVKSAGHGRCLKRVVTK